MVTLLRDMREVKTVGMWRWALSSCMPWMNFKCPRCSRDLFTESCRVVESKRVGSAPDKDWRHKWLLLCLLRHGSGGSKLKLKISPFIHSLQVRCFQH